MGKLVRVDFGKRTIEGGPRSEGTTKTTVSEEEMGADSGFEDSGTERKLAEEFAKECLKDPKIIPFATVSKIKKLEVSPTTLHDQRELVRGYSDEELKRWLMETNEKDWVKKAAFYRAIVDELQSRGCSFI